MKLTFLKKLFTWKPLAALSVLGLTLFMTHSAFASHGPEPYPAMVYLFCLLLLVAAAITLNGGALAAVQPPVLDVDPLPVTNAAIFNVNWTKETMGQDGADRIPGGEYQLSLPFSDYTRQGKTIKPNNHFHMSNGFHFGVPRFSETNAQGHEVNHSFALSFTPIASNQQQQIEGAKWLNAEDNMPLNALNASGNKSDVRLYKPITLKRDNQIIATVNSMFVEQNQVQKENKLNLSFEGIYGPVTTKAKSANFGPGHFSYVFNNLNATLVHELEKEMRDIQHLPKDKQVLLQVKMMKQVHELCQNGSTMTVVYDVNTVSGPVKKQYTVVLADLMKAPTQFAGPMPVDLGLIFSKQ